MRPVKKGDVPTDKNGQPKEYPEYGKAKTDLLRRLGKFCSYCEIELKDGTEVEHVQPKSRRRDLEKEWSNFLLACKRCNTRKGKKQVKLKKCFWPDRDNTLRAFAYLPDSRVVVNPELEGEGKHYAERLLKLVGLDNIPKGVHDDPRFDNRRRAWMQATRTRAKLWESSAKDETREEIEHLAPEVGHFSVWMSVFADDPETRKLLIKVFSGTAEDCFEAKTAAPVKRPGGML